MSDLEFLKSINNAIYNAFNPGDHKTAHETRDGGIVKGSYSLLQPGKYLAC